MKKIIVVFLLIFGLSACQPSDIKVGFIGSLSIKQSQLAVDARNAIALYFDQVNEAGGIHGKMIDLVVKDDEADTDVAIKMHEEFVDEGVDVVIGHVTSNMADAMMQSKNLDLLFVTPSISTFAIDDMDDNIIRTAPTLDGQAIKYLQTTNQLGLKNNLIIYDAMNESYTHNLAKKIIEFNDGNSHYDKVRFDSREDDPHEFINGIDFTGYDSVFFISQAIDTALFAQYVRGYSEDIFMMTVSWSMTNDLLVNGGRSVEGMYILGVFLPEEFSEEYLRFQASFEEKYGYKPTFISFLAYDSASILVQALRETSDYSAQGIKETVLRMKNFDGVTEAIDINEFGDASRSYMIYEVKEGIFTPVR